MNRTQSIILYLWIVLLMSGCGRVSTNNFHEPENLKIEICKSIDIPYTSGDTLIYNSFIGICGNSSQEELDRYYEPHLNEQPYFNMLKERFGGTTLCTGDSLDALMDTLCKSTTPMQTAWECFSKDKIVLSITGNAIDNNSVMIVESYNLNNNSRLIKKVFTYKNDKWVYTIVENTEQ